MTRLISAIDPPVRFETKASFRSLYSSSGVFIVKVAALIMVWNGRNAETLSYEAVSGLLALALLSMLSLFSFWTQLQ